MKHFALVLFITLAGCGKKAETAPVEEQTVEAAPAPVAPLAAPDPATFEQQLNGTVHPEMTARLQMFMQIKGRLPESFYELQNMPGFDSTPGLPLTMKYEIDPKDKTVKVVKK